jgi:hypothetical protein
VDVGAGAGVCTGGMLVILCMDLCVWMCVDGGLVCLLVCV